MDMILGLNGRALSGKDTLADYLISKYGWDGKVAFAGNLKEMCKAVFHLNNFDVYDQIGKKTNFTSSLIIELDDILAIIQWMSKTHPEVHRNITKVLGYIGTKLSNPREVLQIVGTNICRELIITYHVDVVRKKVERAGKWIITDLRFPNEGNLIVDEWKGMAVKIERLGLNGGNINRQHTSEVALENWGRFTDVVKNNREGLEFYYEEIEVFLRRNKLCQDETMITQ
jgi:hypothetical protein